MLNDADADLIFEVGGKQIKCHKNVLAERSQYLAQYLEANKGSTKINISNVPYEACSTVLEWMHSSLPVSSVLSAKNNTVGKVQKIWELGLRFAIPEVVQFCSTWLAERLECENICVFITIMHRYTGLPAAVEGLANDFKKRCFEYLKANISEVQKTPSYFAMIKVSQSIKQEVEKMLAAPSGPAMTPPPPTVRQPTQPKQPQPQPQPQAQPQPQPQPKRTPSKGTAALLSKLKEQPSQPLPPSITQTPPRSTAAEIDEPVYEGSREMNLPVFKPTGRDVPAPSTTSESRNFSFDRDRSLTPQPPVASVAADSTVALFVEDCAEPLQKSSRLATCAEAHAQRKHLKSLMDAVDGGFLASFVLEDGKVDGPGYGIPLRFATGAYHGKCAMRVVVGKVPLPLSSSLSRLPPLSTPLSTPPAKEGKRYDTEKDTVILKHYKLQQEVRVTSHELELFKNDFLDWETSMQETTQLRNIEEGKLRQRIMQQKRQLLSSVYSEMEGMTDTAGSKAQAEKEVLNQTIQGLRSKRESPAVLAIKEEIRRIEEETRQANSVRELIETEIAENRQYEEYSKSYVCAVKQADQELRSFLPTNQSPEALRELLSNVTFKKHHHEREAAALQKSTTLFKKRIAQECNHIKHIRAFLDQN